MAGRDAFGTQFRRGDGESPEIFEVIGNVTDISGPSREKEAIEVTAHDSPDQYREYVSGLKDSGEVQLAINYDPTNETHSLLDDDFEDKELRTYQVVIFADEPDEHTWEFRALITDIGDEFPHDDKAERSVTFKISGRAELMATGS